MHAVNRFIALQNFRPSTKQTYDLCLHGAMLWCSDRGLTLETIPPETFDEYLATKRTTAYRRLILTVCKSFLRAMHPEAPLLAKKSISAEPPTEMRTVGRDDAAAVIDFLWRHRTKRAYRRTLAMFLLSWEGGLRASELCELTLGALDLERCVATVRRKGGKKVTAVPFGRPTAAAISAWLQDRERLAPPGEKRVFLSSEGRPLDRSAWRLCLLRLARRAGVEHFSPHALRRGGSVEMMLAGAPDEVIMKLYGWSDHSLLARYTMAAQLDRARQWLPTAALELPADFLAEAGG